MMGMKKQLGAGTRVKVKSPGPVPSDSTWDHDGHRTSTSVKRRLQQAFFKGDRKISAQIIYIPNETERMRLRKSGHVKLELRDAAGCSLVITSPEGLLAAA